MTIVQRSHVLYIGITGNLTRRVWEHKNKFAPGFTSRYNLNRLVYCELFYYPNAAITREKEIKGWRRSKKIKLIESMNPHWRAGAYNPARYNFFSRPVLCPSEPRFTRELFRFATA